MTGTGRLLPWKPIAINVKPCRFGTLESLFDSLDYALERDIDLYGGGMIDLDAGRTHVLALASLFCPDGPNDLAPSDYHRFDVNKSLPISPLAPPDDLSGIGWGSR